jgi:hypothetical protein
MLTVRTFYASVIMLHVFVLSVVMLNVLAPFRKKCCILEKERKLRYGPFCHVFLFSIL